MSSFRVIIAGGREFKDKALLYSKCDAILSKIHNQLKGDIEVADGGATGADTLGALYAMDRNYLNVQFPADWDKHGKAAGPVRNRQMAEWADALIAFWDGKSPGTKNMIKTAKELDLLIRVIMY